MDGFLGAGFRHINVKRRLELAGDFTVFSCLLSSEKSEKAMGNHSSQPAS
jgi:hypothetical protein